MSLQARDETRKGLARANNTTQENHENIHYNTESIGRAN